MEWEIQGGTRAFPVSTEGVEESFLEHVCLQDVGGRLESVNVSEEKKKVFHSKKYKMNKKEIDCDRYRTAIN